MSSRELWETIYRRFDPTEPVRLDQQEWHAERTYDPIAGVLRKLALPGQSRLLYLGTTGTGKSTELRRLAALQSDQRFVLLLDLVQHFNRVVGNDAALQRVSAWEVCYLAGLGLYQAAAERLSLPWDEDVLRGLEHAWRAAARATGTDAPQHHINMASLAKAVLAGAALALGGPAAGAVVGSAVEAGKEAVGALEWNLPIGRASRSLPADTEEGRGILAAVTRVIGEIQGRHREVVLIIDGLDRIEDLDRIQQLFMDTDLLSRLPCRIVICGPFLLRHHHRINTVRGFDPFLHANEPVLKQDNPRELGNGYAFCRELFRRRVADLGELPLIPEEGVKRLAYYSGGRARDLVRLVRGVAEHVLYDNASAADLAAVDRAIDDERRLVEMGLHRGHIALLRSVMDDPDHRLPEDDELVWDLLKTWRLLPYPNQSEWFYPHPLLTLAMVPP